MWSDCINWLNPPFSKKAKFIRKMLEMFIKYGKSCVLLYPTKVSENAFVDDFMKGLGKRIVLPGCPFVGATGNINGNVNLIILQNKKHLDYKMYKA